MRFISKLNSNFPRNSRIANVILQEVIKAYNSRKGFDFSGLHDYFDSEVWRIIQIIPFLTIVADHRR